MNREAIIRMAQEAASDIGVLIPSEWNEPLLERFAALVAAAEREACAQIAFNSATYIEAAAAIRARGQQ